MEFVKSQTVVAAVVAEVETLEICSRGGEKVISGFGNENRDEIQSAQRRIAPGGTKLNQR